jgi:hypothetical protein
MSAHKSILLFINWNRFQALNQTSRGAYIINWCFNHQKFVSPYQNYLKMKKNKKVYCCFIHCHFWCILRLFRTFRGLYFVKGRSYRQNGVEIRDLHIRNTQENRKIYKPYMVHFWPPSRNRPKMGFLDHYWTGSKGVPFDSEFHEHQEYVVIFALDPS